MSVLSFVLDSPACSPLRVAWWNVTTKLLAQKDMALIPMGDIPHRAKSYTRCREVRKETGMLLTDAEAYNVQATAARTAKVAGDIAELGVYRGGTARLVCEVKGKRNLHLFRNKPNLGLYLTELHQQSTMERSGRNDLERKTNPTMPGSLILRFEPSGVALGRRFEKTNPSGGWTTGGYWICATKPICARGRLLKKRTQFLSPLKNIRLSTI